MKVLWDMLYPLKKKKSYTIYPIAFWIGEVQPLDNDSYFSKQIQKGGNGSPYQGNPEFTQTRNKTSTELLALFKHFYIFVFQKHALTDAAQTDHWLSHTKLKKNSLIAQEKTVKRMVLSLKEFQIIPSILHFWLYYLLYFFSYLLETILIKLSWMLVLELVKMKCNPIKWQWINQNISKPKHLKVSAVLILPKKSNLLCCQKTFPEKRKISFKIR